MISIRVLLFNLNSNATTSCDKYLKGQVAGGGAAGVAVGKSTSIIGVACGLECGLALPEYST